jgi:hypothetical protein
MFIARSSLREPNVLIHFPRSHSRANRAGGVPIGFKMSRRTFAPAVTARIASGIREGAVSQASSRAHCQDPSGPEWICGLGC